MDKEVVLFSYNEFVEKYGEKGLIAVVALVIGLVILYFVIRNMRLKGQKKKIKDVENKISAIKSLPIQYRLGRVLNISKNAPEIYAQYENFEKRYEELMKTQQDEISVLLNEVDEHLYSGKLNKVSSKLKPLISKVNQFESDAKTLLSEIETVTEVENVQRVKIIAVKDKYHQVQENYTNVSYKLEGVPAIAQKSAEIEDNFVSLESMMNQQRFDDAKVLCEEIEKKVDFLNANIRDLPTYLSLANSYIPSEIEKITNHVVELKKAGFSLVRLDCEKRIADMKAKLKNVEEEIQNLNIEAVGSILDEITGQINAINNDFDEEENAQSEFAEIYNDTLKSAAKLADGYKDALNELVELKKQYVVEGSACDIEKEHPQLEKIQKDIAEIKEIVTTSSFSYQEIVEKLRAAIQNIDDFDDKLQAFFSSRDEMYLAEQRAIDELENINIVLLEIKSQIKNKHLPVINDSYKDYIADSYKKANEIQFLCKSKPIMLDNLSKQVDIARDIIYKLYDNIHNLIVTAEMCEEAITFGNRYRSSFLEVNTELTKAEVLYRNGDYTKALSLAVDVIERLKPGSYEKLLRKSQRKSKQSVQDDK